MKRYSGILMYDGNPVYDDDSYPLVEYEDGGWVKYEDVEKERERKEWVIKELQKELNVLYERYK